MRIHALLIALLIGSELFGQSDSIEKAILYQKYFAEEVSLDDFRQIGLKWNQTLAATKYPDLPLNDLGEVQYSYITDFQDISKEKLFNRSLEWLAISYGLFPAYLYSNPEDGKIIFTNSLYINYNTAGTFTCILSIKDEKILMDFINIGYQVTSKGYYSGDYWVPEATNHYTTDKLFPIILQDSGRWSYYLRIVTAINDQITKDLESLNDYIVKYDVRYLF
ncbi:MAG: hypothetical protein JW801_10915 [Bacteroidales bacterium]|nr:hypothetical protein [Bacteroidales bacterium]